ncbi:hypothetical protein T4C_11796 [Trichinella pseudospiralis]|uniref:Uncharacterized protein n=1 Tax=Trichinella pseudospiralis TaxID=6337 RepID=A0A0V1K3C1_TRIPS|nr:hypothetical protein T4C_11796 [Trichinella pseudospiralis]
MRFQRRLSRENCGCNGFHGQAAATEMREKRLKQHHTGEAGLGTQHRKCAFYSTAFACLCNDSLQETDESNIRCGRESEKFLPPQILTTYGLYVLYISVAVLLILE